METLFVKEHIAEVHTGCEIPHCHICNGGLFNCVVCGSAEGASTDHCPGIRMTWYALDQVYAMKLNFRDGMWRHEPASHWLNPDERKQRENVRE